VSAIAMTMMRKMKSILDFGFWISDFGLRVSATGTIQNRKSKI